MFLPYNSIENMPKWRFYISKPDNMALR